VLELAEAGTLLATAETALLSLDQDFSPIRMPDSLRDALQPIPDPVRI
jgi:acyl-CoA thioesterase FadM